MLQSSQRLASARQCIAELVEQVFWSAKRQADGFVTADLE